MGELESKMSTASAAQPQTVCAPREKEISETFRRALHADCEKTRISELLRLPGIGPAMASVILTFYDPKNYGVLDIHAWRELEKKPRVYSKGRRTS